MELIRIAGGSRFLSFGHHALHPLLALIDDGAASLPFLRGDALRVRAPGRGELLVTAGDGDSHRNA